MHYYFNQYVFSWEREEYLAEGILVNLEENPVSRYVYNLSINLK
jgi:hypothetical protein